MVCGVLGWARYWVVTPIGIAMTLKPIEGCLRALDCSLCA